MFGADEDLEKYPCFHCSTYVIIFETEELKLKKKQKPHLSRGYGAKGPVPSFEAVGA